MRFQVAINAPTAINKSAEKPKVSYLNQSHIYSVSVVDTESRRGPGNGGPGNDNFYRTNLCVLPDLQSEFPTLRPQRIPTSATTLIQAELTDSKLVRVDYSGQRIIEGSSMSSVDLEDISSNGFCVKWTTNPATGGSYCMFQIQFIPPERQPSTQEALSAISILIHAKTEQTRSVGEKIVSLGGSEESFCRVQLFAEAAAERRNLEEVLIIQAKADELEKSMQMLSLEAQTLHKWKNDLTVTGTHTNPTTAISDKEAARQHHRASDLEKDLVKLRSWLSSVQPVTIFQPTTVSRETRKWSQISPTLVESQSLQQSEVSKKSKSTPPPKPAFSSFSAKSDEVAPSRSKSKAPEKDLVASSQIVGSLPAAKRTLVKPPANLTRIPKRNAPLQSRNPKAPICFYVRTERSNNAYHRAVYIQERTISALLLAISIKFIVHPGDISNISFSDLGNIQTTVDEEVLQDLEDGQDMVVQFTSAQTLTPESFKVSTIGSTYSCQTLTPPSTVCQGQPTDETFDFNDFISDLELSPKDISAEVVQQQLQEYPQSTATHQNNFQATHLMWKSYETEAFSRPKPESKCSDTSMQLDQDDTCSMLKTSDLSTTTVLHGELPVHTEDAFGPSSESSLYRAGKRRRGRDGEKPLSDADREVQRQHALHRNRIAASRCRMKRIEEQEAQQLILREKEMENTLLKHSVSEMKAEVFMMNMLLTGHTNCASRLRGTGERKASM